MPQRAAGPREASAPDPGARRLLALLLALLLAPSVWLAYLPMTDLPQHLAVASILLHHDDPRFGFAAFYEPAWGRSLYLLPYLGALALAPLALARNRHARRRRALARLAAARNLGAAARAAQARVARAALLCPSSTTGRSSGAS